MPDFTSSGFSLFFPFLSLFLALLAMGMINAGVTIFLMRWVLGWPQTRTSTWITFASLSLVGMLLPAVSLILVIFWCIMVVVGGLGAVGVLSPRTKTILVQATGTPRRHYTVVAAALDFFGVAALILLGLTAAFAVMETNSFVWVFGHAMLYLFLILIPLYLTSIWLTLRLLIRVVRWPDLCPA